VNIIHKQVTGDLIITEEAQYNHLLCDNLIVEENITTRLYGIIQKDVTIKKGSIIYLHGRIHGKVTNEGGVLYSFEPSGEINLH
jgi:hypothetical protein